MALASGLISLLSWPALALASPPSPESTTEAPATDAAPSEAPSEEPEAEASETANDSVEPAPIEAAEPAPVEAAKPGLVADEATPPDEKMQLPVNVGDRHSITYTNLLAPRVNPLGLEERLWIGYQYRLYDKTGDIWKGSNIGIFLRPILSPAIGLVGPTVQIQPLAILRLRATWSYVGWFGTFSYMESYQSPWDDFSDTRLSAQKDRGENYATTGHQTELELLFQVRFKQIVLRNTFTADYNVMKLRGDDDVFYDIRVDALVPNGNNVFIGGNRIETFRAGTPGYNVIQAAAPDGVGGVLDVTLPQLNLSGTLVGLTAQRIDFGALSRDICQIGDESSFSVLGRRRDGAR